MRCWPSGNHTLPRFTLASCRPRPGGQAESFSVPRGRSQYGFLQHGFAHVAGLLSLRGNHR
jgi:hypothetical protein